MYLVLLHAHSWVRWLVVASALAIAAYATNARMRGTPWSPKSVTYSRIWVGITDLQVVIGLVLFFTEGGTAHAAHQSVSLAMKEPTLRFFGYVHPLAMTLAFIGTHATWVAVRRTEHGPARYRRLSVGSIAVLALVVGSIPWTFLSYGRPLLRSQSAGSQNGTGLLLASAR